MKKLKETPKLKNDEEVDAFWSTHDSTDYVDWSKGRRALFPNLKPTSKLISIRFPVSILDRLKAIASRQQIPYQSLIKKFINSGIKKALHG